MTPYEHILTSIAHLKSLCNDLLPILNHILDAAHEINEENNNLKQQIKKLIKE